MCTLLFKEFKAYFTSAIGYVFMTFYVLVFGLYFCLINLRTLNGNYSLIFNYLVNLLLFTIPIVTMRLLSEEKKNKTDQLLLTSPIHTYDIVLGKYLAAVLLFFVTLSITFVFPIILSFLGRVPWGIIISSYIGYFLLGATLIAISLFISALTENQIISAISSIGLFMGLLLVDVVSSFIPPERLSSLIFLVVVTLLLCLYLLNATKSLYLSLMSGFVVLTTIFLAYHFYGQVFDGLCTKLLKWFSLFSRYTNFNDGLLDIGATIYYLSFIFIFLFLTHQSIEKRRWN